MLEKRLRVKALVGLSWELCGLIARRLASLDATVWIFRPDGEGVEMFCRGSASRSFVRELKRLEVEHGVVLKVKAEGPGAELAVGEIEHLLAHPDPDPHGDPCYYAAQGPRGPWHNIDGHMYGTSLGDRLAEEKFNNEAEKGFGAFQGDGDRLPYGMSEDFQPGSLWSQLA